MPTPTDTNLARSTRSGIGYYGALDGLRALAIVAVLLYHGGVVWANGGFLGVEVFFVLSGFLITSLLIAEWRGSATIALPAFWARRARRLLPALFCMVAVVGLHEALASGGSSLPGLRGDRIAALPTRVRRLRRVRDRALRAGARGWQDAGPVPVGPVRGPAPRPRRIAIPGRVACAACRDQLATSIGRRPGPGRGACVEHRPGGLAG